MFVSSVVCDSPLLYRFVLEEKVLEMEIEPGMRDGYQYPFVAEGINVDT